MNQGLIGNHVAETTAAANWGDAFAVFTWNSTVGHTQLLMGKNVASINKNGTGDYTVRFSRPFSHPNFAVSVTAQGNTNIVSACVSQNDINGPGEKRVVVTLLNGTAVDPAMVYFGAWGPQ